MRMKGTKENTMPLSVCVGVIICVMVSLIGTSILSSMVLGERFREDAIEYYVLGIQFIAAGTGTLVACKMIKGKTAIISAAVAGVYLLLAFGITILFFEGRFNGILRSLLAVLFGSVASCAICIGKGKRGPGRKRAFR